MVVDQQIKQLQTERADLVRAARAERQSWRSIAEALGVSRQAVWEAHRASTAVVEQIRSRSTLSETEAMTVATDALRESRAQQPR
jgi:predicted DNA-binding protein YlxM (UPF0122 family)